MKLQDYANLGMAAMTGNAGYARTVAGQAVASDKEAERLHALAAYAVASGNVGQPAMTGWTPPTITYEKMRQTNASALALDADIKRNVTRDMFLTAWKQWFLNWRAFFDKYQGSWTNTAKLGAAFYSDELAERAEEYRAQLEGWFAGYSREKRPDGENVPPPTAPLPPKPALGPADEKNAGGVPWWLISLITVGVISVGVGVAFALRKAYRETEAKREVLEKKVLPIVLGSQLGPAGVALAEAAAARPSRDQDGYTLRDLDSDLEYDAGPETDLPKFGRDPDRYVPLYVTHPYGGYYEGE
jgi:hypothetical protein